MKTTATVVTHFGDWRQPKQYADFRSDTVTKPCEKMRDAMANAVVGDDVFGDDPTSNKFIQNAADLFGKEAALLTTSGT